MMRIKFILPAVFGLFSLGLIGQPDEEYGETLKKMFEVSGSEETYQTVVRNMSATFRQQNPQLGDEWWDEFEKEFSETSIDELVERLTPVYERHLSQEDLQAVVEFYESPAGKRFAESTPLITGEAMKVGEEWGRSIAQRILNRIQAAEE